MVKSVDQIVTDLVTKSESAFNEIGLSINNINHLYKFSYDTRLYVNQAMKQLDKHLISLNKVKVFLLLTDLLFKNYEFLVNGKADCLGIQLAIAETSIKIEKLHYDLHKI